MLCCHHWIILYMGAALLLNKLKVADFSYQTQAVINVEKEQVTKA